MTNDLQLRAINTIRFLATDAVQQANSGYPGPAIAFTAAYGWKPDLSDEEILEKLLSLNLERAK